MVKENIGSRAKVMYGKAKKTSGGLRKRNLKYNKQGKIVSRKASRSAKKSKNLIKAGYLTQKGKFGSYKVGGQNPSSKLNESLPLLKRIVSIKNGQIKSYEQIKNIMKPAKFKKTLFQELGFGRRNIQIRELVDTMNRGVVLLPKLSLLTPSSEPPSESNSGFDPFSFKPPEQPPEQQKLNLTSLVKPPLDPPPSESSKLLSKPSSEPPSELPSKPPPNVRDFFDDDNRIKRLMSYRPLAFVGNTDRTLLRNDQEILGNLHDADGDSNYFKYNDYHDIYLASLCSYGGPTHVINDGNRNNNGVPGVRGTYIPKAIYVGCVGARFERPGFMDWQSTVITEKQNTVANCYGVQGRTELGKLDYNTLTAKQKTLLSCHQLFGTLPTFEEAKISKEKIAVYTQEENRFMSFKRIYFDLVNYRKRMEFTIHSFLHYANEQAKRLNIKAYVHVVGLGLGAWTPFSDRSEETYKIIKIQIDIYREYINNLNNNHIGEIDFSWFQLKNDNEGSEPKYFDENINGTRFFSSINNPFSIKKKKVVSHVINGTNINYTVTNEDMLEYQWCDFDGISIFRTPNNSGNKRIMIAQYAWDGNSFPGNEYWMRGYTLSGDPAAACCSTIPIIHNMMVCGLVDKKLYSLNTSTLIKKQISSQLNKNNFNQSYGQLSPNNQTGYAIEIGRYKKKQNAIKAEENRIAKAKEAKEIKRIYKYILLGPNEDNKGITFLQKLNEIQQKANYCIVFTAGDANKVSHFITEMKDSSDVTMKAVAEGIHLVIDKKRNCVPVRTNVPNDFTNLIKQCLDYTSLGNNNIVSKLNFFKEFYSEIRYGFNDLNFLCIDDSLDEEYGVKSVPGEIYPVSVSGKEIDVASFSDKEVYDLDIKTRSADNIKSKLDELGIKRRCLVLDFDCTVTRFHFTKYLLGRFQLPAMNSNMKTIYKKHFSQGLPNDSELKKFHLTKAQVVELRDINTNMARSFVSKMFDNEEQALKRAQELEKEKSAKKEQALKRAQELEKEKSAKKEQALKRAQELEKEKSLLSNSINTHFTRNEKNKLKTALSGIANPNQVKAFKEYIEKMIEEKRTKLRKLANEKPIHQPIHQVFISELEKVQKKFKGSSFLGFGPKNSDAKDRLQLAFYRTLKNSNISHDKLKSELITKDTIKFDERSVRDKMTALTNVLTNNPSIKVKANSLYKVEKNGKYFKISKRNKPKTKHESSKSKRYGKIYKLIDEARLAQATPAQAKLVEAAAGGSKKKKTPVKKNQSKKTPVKKNQSKKTQVKKNQTKKTQVKKSTGGSKKKKTPVKKNQSKKNQSKKTAVKKNQSKKTAVKKKTPVKKKKTAVKKKSQVKRRKTKN